MGKKRKEKIKIIPPETEKKLHSVERVVKISKHTEKDPYNEFEENPLLMYSAFPRIFLLGKGIQQQGSIPKAAVRHLLLQYDGRAANCLRLVFLLFNQNNDTQQQKQ